jgi:hypothetical protein
VLEDGLCAVAVKVRTASGIGAPDSSVNCPIIARVRPKDVVAVVARLVPRVSNHAFNRAKRLGRDPFPAPELVMVTVRGGDELEFPAASVTVIET